MRNHFIPFSGGASGPAGKLIAVAPANVSAIYSQWDKTHKQSVLCILLNSSQVIKVYEQDAPSALEDLGLGQFADSWVLDLETDLG
jgi:hypothetical protein